MRVPDFYVKIDHYLRHENKARQNKVLSYCEALLFHSHILQRSAILMHIINHSKTNQSQTYIRHISVALMLYTYSVYVYIDGVCYISGRWVLHIWTSVTYLDDGCYISGRLLPIWTMEVTYLDDCYISGRLHICMSHVPAMCGSERTEWRTSGIGAMCLRWWISLHAVRHHVHRGQRERLINTCI